MGTREPVGERRWSISGVPGGERFAARLRFGRTAPYLLLRASGTQFEPPEYPGGWLVVTFAVGSVTVGPYFQRGESPCWRCFQDWGFVEGTAEGLTRVPKATAVIVQRALDRPGRFAGRIEVTHTRKRATTVHRILQRPQCPACGDPSLAVSPGFPVVRPSLDIKAVDLRRFADPLTGIVARIDCYHAAAGFAAAAARFYPPGRRAGVDRAFGCGASAAKAQAIAIAESLERYSLYSQGTEPRVEAAFGDVKEMAISPH